MIHFVVALPCEAKPIIDHFSLKSVDLAPSYRLFEADDMRLILSGVGKINAAAATAYMQANYGNPNHAAWLNIGIAGHGRGVIGEGLLANRITDESSGKSWYPPAPDISGVLSGRVVTVDKPETHYTDETLYDMEASGFYAIASQFSSSELVQSFKIVSDNFDTSTDSINKESVEEYVRYRLPQIEALTYYLISLASELRQIEADPKGFDLCLQRWRFTTYQRHQLRRLLQRIDSLCPGEDVFSQLLLPLKSATAVIEALEARLRAINLPSG